jgi:hypothetical protein
MPVKTVTRATFWTLADWLHYGMIKLKILQIKLRGAHEGLFTRIFSRSKTLLLDEAIEIVPSCLIVAQYCIV